MTIYYERKNINPPSDPDPCRINPRRGSLSSGAARRTKKNRNFHKDVGKICLFDYLLDIWESRGKNYLEDGEFVGKCVIPR